MTIRDKPHPRVLKAFELEGDEEQIKEFYADWADNYDKDTSNLNYTGCETTFDFLMTLPTSDPRILDLSNKNLTIMDVGCGTGQMGQILFEHDYHLIDGCDISLEMTQIADKRKVYKDLTPNVDINQPILTHWQKKYDLSISVGVFTPGHVEPEALNQLIGMTRTGGIVIVSTRIAYYEQTQYQLVSDQLEKENKVQLINVKKNLPYTNDSLAHYWAYYVL